MTYTCVRILSSPAAGSHWVPRNLQARGGRQGLKAASGPMHGLELGQLKQPLVRGDLGRDGWGRFCKASECKPETLWIFRYFGSLTLHLRFIYMCVVR